MIQLIYNRSSFLFFALFIFLTVSCGKAPLVDKSMDVNETAWDVKEILNIDVRIDDTISTFNFYVNIRNTTDYKNSNFFLFIKTTFPNGQIAIDTLECILADNQGKWFGKGNGKIKDSRITLLFFTCMKKEIQHQIFLLVGVIQIVLLKSKSKKY